MTAGSLVGGVRYALGLVWRADRRGFVLVVTSQLASALVLVGLVLLARHALTDVLAVSTGDAEEASATLIPVLAATVALGTMSGILRAVGNGRQRVVVARLDRHVIGLVLRSAAQADLPTFERPEFHDRLQRAVFASRMQPAMVVTAMAAALQAFVTVAAVVVVLALLAWWLLPFVAIAAVPMLKTSRDERRAGYGLHHALAENKRIRQYLERVLTGWQEAKEIRALRLGETLRARWDDQYELELRATVAMNRTHAWRKALGRIAGDLVTISVIGAVWWQVAEGRIALPAALAALAALWQLSLRMQMVGGLLNGVSESLIYLADLQSLSADLRPADRGSPPPAVFRGLRADRVTFSYPGAAGPTLRDVSVSVAPGEIVALVGANGSGKTTLTKILAGLYTPDEGALRHGDQPVGDPAELQRITSVVFQDFVRYRLSALDNITFGRPEAPADEARAREVAGIVDVHDALARLPRGYATPLSPEFADGAELSGGQWQRLALARAFYRDAPFVILDEPTAALDPQAEAELFDQIRTLFAGRSVLLISHRFSTVRSADRIYVLQDGEVVESGDHEALMHDDGTYARLFRLQAKAYLEPVLTVDAPPAGR